MSIFDAFTGDPAKDAAEQSRNFLLANRLANEGTIRGGQQTSLGNITAGYGQQRDALSYVPGLINEGAANSINYLQGGAAAGRDAFGRARGDLNNSIAAFDPLASLGTKYGGATTLALNALGVGGADGTAAARDAFTASPAYNFNLEQGLDAINRRRNAAGMLDSGNADRDAQLFGAGLASQEYDKWLTNLLGFTNPELSATSGAATGRATGMRSLADLGVREADLETTLGRNLAGVETGRAGMLADLQRTLAGTYPAEGAALAGINTGAANAVVNAYNAAAPGVVDSYKQEGDAAMQGSKNLINFGMNVASLAAGGLGGMGGLGSLGSLFGGSSFSGLGGNPNQSMAGVDPYGQFYNYA